MYMYIYGCGWMDGWMVGWMYICMYIYIYIYILYIYMYIYIYNYVISLYKRSECYDHIPLHIQVTRDHRYI